MRSDIGTSYTGDIERNAQVLLWKGERVSDIVRNQASSSNSTDISPTVSNLTVSSNKVSATLAWSDEYLTCADQPTYGDFVQVIVDGYTRMLAMVVTIDSITESRGTRTMSITARSSDGISGWKDSKASTSLFPKGTGLQTLAQNVMERFLSLNIYEYLVPHISYSVIHANVQLAEMSPWEMLEEIYRVSGHAPFVNGLCQVDYYSKDIVGRPSDVVVPRDRVLEVSGSRSGQGVDRVVLEWLDPNLSREYQDEQVLYSTSMTSGFFKPEVKEEAWFSSDRSQRAEATRMNIVESVNSGLIPVADESYEEKGEYHGEIILKNTYWAAGLATASLVAMISYSQTPDLVVGSTLPSGGTAHTHSVTLSTDPVGRIVTVAAQAALMLAMMSIGVGRYEIWGKPYDYVHAKNKLIVVSSGASAWMRNIEEIQSDLVVSRSHAQAVCTRELVFKNLEANTWGLTIVDDPRIEVGDIVEVEGYGRLFVTEWDCDLTRGSKALMKLSGFRC